MTVHVVWDPLGNRVDSVWLDKDSTQVSRINGWMQTLEVSE